MLFQQTAIICIAIKISGHDHGGETATETLNPCFMVTCWTHTVEALYVTDVSPQSPCYRNKLLNHRTKNLLQKKTDMPRLRKGSVMILSIA